MFRKRRSSLATTRALLWSTVMLCSGSLIGCALPTGSVVLENRPADPRLSDSTREIPQEWEGRLFRVGVGAVTLGGEATHSHTFDHVAQGYSGPSSVQFQPLGLKSIAASGSHVHLLVSQSQDPSVTGPAPNLPPSVPLLTRIVTSSHFRPIEGQIIAYVGKGIPKGWVPCDGANGTPAMQGKYVVLSRGSDVPGAIGSDTHLHDASHKDTWGVAAPDPAVGTNKALHLDYYPAVHPTQTASPLSHTHRAVEPVPAVASTSVERVRPPTIEVLYLQATSAARSMPTGAVIPFIGTNAPMGWAFWSEIGSTPVDGRFPAGSMTADPGGLYGGETHTHTVTATHHVILYPNPAGPPQDVSGKGPPVAAVDHGHTADISETFTTAPASHIPLYVSVRFIIKE